MTNPPTDRRPDVLAHARFVKDRLLIAHAKGRLPHRVKRPFHPSQTGVGVGVDHRHPRDLLATRAGTTGCPQFVGRRSPPTSVGFPAGFGLASSGLFGRVLDAPAALNVTPYVLARFVITPVLDQPTEVGAARWLDPDGYIGMPLCLPRRIVDNDARGAALPKPLPSARTPRLRMGNRPAVSPPWLGLTSHLPRLTGSTGWAAQAARDCGIAIAAEGARAPPPASHWLPSARVVRNPPPTFLRAAPEPYKASRPRCVQIGVAGRHLGRDRRAQPDAAPLEGMFSHMPKYIPGHDVALSKSGRRLVVIH
jgi:hypothetical protein